MLKLVKAIMTYANTALQGSVKYWPEIEINGKFYFVFKSADFRAGLAQSATILHNA